MTPKELNFLSKYILWFAVLVTLSVFSLDFSCESNTVPKYFLDFLNIFVVHYTLFWFLNVPPNVYDSFFGFRHI